MRVPLYHPGAGEVSELTRRLRGDNRYKLWCSLAGHKELGMRAELRVR